MNATLAILEALMNSLWQAVIVAALVWLALRFLPLVHIELNAATRYAIWWAALAVVLVLPVAPTALRAMRARPQPPALKAPASPKLAPLPARATEPVIITLASDRTARWPLAVVAVWAAILLFRLGQITRSYFYLRGVKRRAAVSPIPLPASGRRADILISPDVLSPMAVGFARPAVILPESLLNELSDSEREHVLLHEMAHLAGYDDWSNLAMRLIGAVLALHPIAIWILHRIEREREMVCDDWVVARTSEARPYAATLARLFEMRWAKQNQALAPGLFGRGARVGDRIELLLRRGRTFSPRASRAGISTSTFIFGAVIFGASLSPRWIAFAQKAETTFEVASIRLNTSGSEGSIVDFPETGKLAVTNATVKTLIRNAYGAQNDQIAAGGKSPGFVLESVRYDIHAKTAGPIREDRVPLLMQNLLADRFHLIAHWENRELPSWALRVAKAGPKFQQNTGPNGAMSISRGPEKARIAVERASMNQLAGILGKQLGRVVRNETALQGFYDFTLEWTPEQTRDSLLPSLFSALGEQLGLKLESSKGPVPVLVIDHVEQPDAN